MNKIISKEDTKVFKELVPNGIFESVDLSKISRWKIGGIADCIIKPSSSSETARIVKYLHKNGIPFLVIGSTSNLLFSDDGLRAVCVQIGNRMSDYKILDNKVWVQAGKWVPSLAREVAIAGLSGIEHTAGIPGTIGGLITMNGGSQRKGIGSHIENVTAISDNGRIKKFLQRDCKFEYRSSIFQEQNYIITEAELNFTDISNYKVIRNEMLDILRNRREKFPQKLPNCGSTFISNPNMYEEYGPPGKIIQELGFAGYRIGDAIVSTQHANFINNLDKASARDVLQIINEIRDKVKKETGFDLITEVKYVTSDGKLKNASDV